MMKGFVKSKPYFFRLIKLSMALGVTALLVLAALIPAPLQEPADIARVPNPVKSAWFLLWIQELVSYSKYLINFVILLAVIFILLPWLPGSTPARKAEWWRREQLPVNISALTLVVIVVTLTIIAMFFRGKNWDFIVPF